MNRDEAKLILSACRPEGGGAVEPPVREALELARNDPALAEWLRREQRFDLAISQALHSVPVPAGLKPAILAGAKVLEQLVWWQLVNWRRVAVCGLTLLVGAGFFWFSFTRTQGLVGGAKAAVEMAEARSAGLAVKDGGLESVRKFLSRCGAPADFEVPRHMRKLQVMGCTLVALQDQTAAVVRFRIAGNAQLTLLVVDRVLDEDLLESGRVRTVEQGGWGLALWTDGKKTYVLAGKVPPESLLKIVS
jgi:hypothetical protein